MNVIGGGLICVVIYATNGGLAVQDAILAENGNELLAEDGNYLEIE